MGKEEKKDKKKKPIFEKVGLVFRNPVRADILQELSSNPQRAKNIADNIGIPKQNLNYHLNALKKGGLIKTHQKEFSEGDFQQEKGTRINGISKDGKTVAIECERRLNHKKAVFMLKINSKK